MDSDSKTKLRRRLLKGGLAGPAVFTLQSGTAWAQQSISCLEKTTRAARQDGFPPVKVSTRGQDQWMREARTTFNLGGPTATQQLGARVNSRFTLGADGQYMELVPRTLRRVEGPLVGVMTRETGLVQGAPGVMEQNKVTEYFLVAYDIDGVEIMYNGEAFPAQGFIAVASAGLDQIPPCVASVRASRQRV
jgi:hypothetical protein